MRIDFDLPTITGLLIAYLIAAAIMYILNKCESKMDVKLSALEAEERRRMAAERAAKRKGGASMQGGLNPVYAAAAVAAVEMHRKG